MKRFDQNAIFSGQWAIVSTYINGEDQWEGDRYALDQAVLDAAKLGIPVSVVKGRWNGIEERAIMLQGPDAYDFALAVAARYKQEAYIEAMDGLATLYGRTAFPTHWKELQTFTSMVESADADNYTELANGFRFVLK